MRTILKLSLLLLTFASVARGQSPIMAGMAPVVEGGVGFTYVQAKVPSEGTLGMNGAQAVLNTDLNRHFGVKLDLGYARAFDAFNTGRSADMLTYMGGPVFYPVRGRRVELYTELLLGGARETGVNLDTSGQTVLGFVNKFAWAGGGGVQYRLTRSFSMRVGADYLRTSFFNSNVAVESQPNIRSSINFIYTFGERE